jgi:hypothetical protein
MMVTLDCTGLSSAEGVETTYFAGRVALTIDGVCRVHRARDGETDREAGWFAWVCETIGADMGMEPEERADFLDEVLLDACMAYAVGERTEWRIDWEVGADAEWRVEVHQVVDVKREAQETVDECARRLRAIAERSYAPGEMVDTESMLRLGRALQELDGVVLWSDGGE